MMASSLSKTVTLMPAWASNKAVKSPTGPAPTTQTVLEEVDSFNG